MTVYLDVINYENTNKELDGLLSNKYRPKHKQGCKMHNIISIRATMTTKQPENTLTTLSAISPLDDLAKSGFLSLLIRRGFFFSSRVQDVMMPPYAQQSKEVEERFYRKL